MPRREIRNARILVTGASSGIGRALAKQLADEGASILITARREDRLQQLADELAADGGQVAIAAGDITDKDHRLRLLETAQFQLGGLDVLVNNAGIGAVGHFVPSDPERLRKIMEVNFFAVAEMIRESHELLLKSESPAIVNVGSVLGHRAVPSKSEYCASKFALHGLTDALHGELRRDGIDVILISPSTTTSEFADSLIEDRGGAAKNPYGMSSEDVARQIIRAIRAGRREVILSLTGKLLVWIDRICPPLASWIVQRFG